MVMLVHVGPKKVYLYKVKKDTKEMKSQEKPRPWEMKVIFIGTGIYVTNVYVKKIYVSVLLKYLCIFSECLRKFRLYIQCYRPNQGTCWVHL